MRFGWLAALALFLLMAARADANAAVAARPFGLETRPVSRAFLNLPERADGALPRLLSETGAFQSAVDLKPVDGLIPYDLVLSFWSDGASKLRWMSLPGGASGTNPKIRFSRTGEWKFPAGTVFVKHFELPVDETRPELKRRLETRLLVCDAAGGVYGVTYKWHPDNRDAELLTSNLFEPIEIKTATGTRTQVWYYPSRQDCLTCHTPLAGGVLGVKTRQLNREFLYPGGVTDNELRAWNHAGLFAPELSEPDLAACPSLAREADPSRGFDDRARSFLDVNCGQCHRPGGTVAAFDARYDTPLDQQNLINGPVLIDQGVDHAKLVAPNDIWRSILYMRANTVEGMKMPPLAHQTVDTKSMALLRQWIESLPGPPVLSPVLVSPSGGDFPHPVEVTLRHPEPGVTIHYTLDGSVPTPSDPVYEHPLKVTDPTTIRAKAYKPGFTKSITVQETFIIGG